MARRASVLLHISQRRQGAELPEGVCMVGRATEGVCLSSFTCPMQTNGGIPYFAMVRLPRGRKPHTVGAAAAGGQPSTAAAAAEGSEPKPTAA